MTNQTGAHARLAWLRRMSARTLAAALCLFAVTTVLADAPVLANTSAPLADIADSDVSAMSLAASLEQEQASKQLAANEHTAQSPAITTEDGAGMPLRLEPMLSSFERLIEAQIGPAGSLAQTPSKASILKFLFCFALLLLVSLTLRDALRLFRHLLSPPPAPPPSMPFAPWPSVTAIFESNSPQRITENLAALVAADYPAERLKIMVLCPMHDIDVFDAIQGATKALPGRVVAMQRGTDGDIAGRCFNAGLRFGNGELVLVLSDTHPCPANAIKACAERFFNPSLGALLGFLPEASADDRALAPRIASLLRIASQTAGMTSTAGMTPGTSLLALRRSAVRTAGLKATHATDCFALLRQLERFGSHHAVQEGVTAAGDAVHNWEGRSRWIEHCAHAFAASVPLNPLRYLIHTRAVPLNFGMQGKLMLPALWCIVAASSIVLYFTGNALAAAAGLTVCAATAYGVDGMPSAFNCTAVLFRVHGRRAEASLVAWAPVMFCHDTMVAVRSGTAALWRRAFNRRPMPHGSSITSITTTAPLEQSTLS